MDTKKIVILGGPGTGKSSIINHLKEKGFHCFPEVSRQVIIEAQQKGIEQLFLTEPLLFSEKLLEGRIKQHQEAAKSDQEVVFIDRGIPDITAYMDYRKDIYPATFMEANQLYKYEKAFILPVWEEIYTSDNERYETFEQAVKIQEFIENTYTTLGYELIYVPKASVQERAQFILNNCGLS